MAALSPWLLLLVCSAPSLSADVQTEPGAEAALQCRALRDQPVLVVKWSRRDLGEEYVLLYRDKQIVPFYQNPSFKNRAFLKDPQLRGGDVSLVLKDVRNEDGGTYECRVFQRRASDMNEPICTVHLSVTPPPPGGFEKLVADDPREPQKNQDEGSDEENRRKEPAAESNKASIGEQEVGGAYPEEAGPVVAEALQAHFGLQPLSAGKPDGPNRVRGNLRGHAGLMCSMLGVAGIVAAMGALIWRRQKSSASREAAQV